MSNSNIIIRTRYKSPKNSNKNIKNWMKYVSKKENADSTSLDDRNLMSDYLTLANEDEFFKENNESFLWNEFGNINPKQDIEKVDDNGFVWNIVVSFQPEFAINNGLITKADYYDLTKNIMPSLITDMGLKINNTIWYAGLHRNTDNPHLHIMIAEKNKTANNGFIPKFAIKQMKSNIANYLINNTEFYKLRDKEFSNITGNISLTELTKIKNQNLYSDKFRKTLNKKLLSLYKNLPKNGRLQYNSKNINKCKPELDNIIHFILNHDSIKYNYANYLRLLEKHQSELNNIYGMSDENKNRKYYNDQLNRLYSKIGNEILSNYKIYKSMDLMTRERSFLSKHINELKFKSRSDYAKDETKINIAKNLYKLCIMSNLNDKETEKVFERWIKNSKYNFNVKALILSVSTTNYEMSSSEYYNTLKKLGYDYQKYIDFRNKYFYKELNYKRFINQAFNHLKYELEKEEKQIISEIQYELDSL